MNIKEMLSYISEINPDALLADGFDDAIIGIGNQHGTESLVIYDRTKCIDILAKKFSKNDHPYIDAVEYFEYNVAGAYLGKGTPIFMDTIEDLSESL